MKVDPEKIDALFAEWDKPDSPGCVVAVIRDREIAYQRGYGVADLESGTPMTPDSVFYIASVSKQFTAACVLLLARSGAVSLDDEIHGFFPELPEYGHPVTVRHLIHHTSRSVPPSPCCAATVPGSLAASPSRARWPGGRLALNADAAGGYLTVRVTDLRRSTIPGFAHDDSIALREDEIRHQVTWKGADIAGLEGRLIRLEFGFRNADLFAFLAET